MLGPKGIRTGIDLGGATVKLVRGHGAPRLRRITHVGWEEVQVDLPAGRAIPVGAAAPEAVGGAGPAGPATGPVRVGGGLPVDEAAEALRRLLRRLGLSRRKLGRVAVGLPGPAGSFREVELPELSEQDLRQALPFEARRHLDVDAMRSPILDAQVLGSGDPDPETGAPQLRILLAAAPRRDRDQVLEVLDRAGLEAEVVDLQPLAGLNAVLAEHRPAPAEAIALLDIGARHAALHVSGPDGDLLSRTLAGGPPPEAAALALAAYAESVAGQVHETVTFYRGRYRRQVESIVLAGGGSLIVGLPEALQRNLEIPLTVLDPLTGLADSARGRQEADGREPLFLTACGLCRWWDGADV